MSTPRKQLLICTIVRNALPHLDTWMTQLADLAAALKDEYECWYSVYENDSTDGSDQWLRRKHDMAQHYARVSGGQLTWDLTTAKLGTQQYGSVWNEDRLRNLAAARQQCLDQVEGGLSRFDKVAYIEPDVTYDPQWAAELVLARHPRAAGFGEPDIYSGWSLRSLKHPKESIFLYDTCATRQTKDHSSWDFANEHAWRANALIPTYLSHVDSNCLYPVWSTFNCFCVYSATPFKEGALWDYVNPRLNTGQPWIEGRFPGIDGYLDADTSVICEVFRARGYGKIFLNTNCLIRHA